MLTLKKQQFPGYKQTKPKREGHPNSQMTGHPIYTQTPVTQEYPVLTKASSLFKNVLLSFITEFASPHLRTGGGRGNQQQGGLAGEWEERRLNRHTAGTVSGQSRDLSPPKGSPRPSGPTGDQTRTFVIMALQISKEGSIIFYLIRV